MLQNSGQNSYIDFPKYDLLREIIRKQDNLPNEPVILNLLGGSRTSYDIAVYGLALWIYEGVKPKIYVNQVNPMVRDGYALMCQWHKSLREGFRREEFLSGRVVASRVDFGTVDQFVWQETHVMRQLNVKAYSGVKGSSFLDVQYRK